MHEAAPAGPAVNCKRLLCQLARTALAAGAPGPTPNRAHAPGLALTYPVTRGGALHYIAHADPENQIASVSPRTAVEPMLGQSA